MSNSRPELPKSLEKLLREIGEDRDHGARELAIRSLDNLGSILAEESVSAETREQFLAQLRTIRPSMVIFSNLADRLAKTFEESNPADAVNSISEELSNLPKQVTETVRELSPNPGFVVTFSYSSSVVEVMKNHPPEQVLIPQSVPGGEGIRLANELAQFHDSVEFCYESELGKYVTDVDEVWVGADQIRPEEGIVNKTGTRQICELFSGARKIVLASSWKSVREDSPLDPEPAPGPSNLSDSVIQDHELFEFIEWNHLDAWCNEEKAIRK